MIKKYLLTFCIITVALVAHGQSYLGIKAGMDATNLTSSQSDAKFVFLGGLTLEIPISENFSFYPGLLFSFNRFKGTDKLKEDYSLQAFSLEVPVLLIK